MNRDNYQSYISEELTHFVGKNLCDDNSRYSLLLNILSSKCLSNSEENAALPYKSAALDIDGTAKLSENEMYVPQMVCFCDIPICQLNIHVEKYGKFGIAFSKDFLVRNGGMPVHYIPRKARESTAILKGEFYDSKAEKFMGYLQRSNGNMADIMTDIHTFLAYNVFAYIKFFDHTLPDRDANNYYFEREWRVLGNLGFTEADVKRVFVPQAFEKRFQKDSSIYGDRIYPL